MFLDIIFIMILVFIVQYFVMSIILTNLNLNITNNLNKIYISTILALIVGFIYVLMMNFKLGLLIDYNYYIGFGICSGIFIYAYKNQIGITDYDWANSMIELQSNGILISKIMSNQEPTNDNKIKCIEFSKYIVKSQQEQIDLLKQLAFNSNTKGLFY